MGLFVKNRYPILFWIAFLTTPNLCANTGFNNTWQARISLEDSQGAFELYKKFTETHSDPKLWSEEELSLACKTCYMRHDTQTLYDLFCLFQNDSKYKKNLRIICETTSWTLLSLGFQEHHPKLRFESILGTAMSGDSRAIPFIISAIKDTNRNLRQFGFQIAHFFPDRSVQKTIIQEACRGTKEEKIAALELLEEQEAIDISEFVEQLKKETSWNENEKAFLILVDLISKEKQGKIEEILPLFQTGLASKTKPERLAMIQFGEKKRALRFLEPIINLLLIHEETHHDIILEAMSAIGSQIELIPSELRSELISSCHTLTESKIHMVQIRALWLLFLLDKDNTEITKKIYSVLLTQKNSAIHNLMIAHIRALGPAGVSLASYIFQELESQFHFLPIEAKITLCMYLIEQQQPPFEKISSTLLSLLQQTKNMYLTYDVSLGSAFEIVSISTTPQFHPFLPRMRQVQDLSLRLKIFSMAYSIAPTPPTVDFLLSIFQERDIIGCEYAAIQLFHGELKIPLQDIEGTVLSQASPMKKLSFAAIMSILGREEDALQIIRSVIHEPSLSKENLESALWCLSNGFQLEQVEDIIMPHLFNGSISIRVRAAGSYLSSLTH